MIRVVVTGSRHAAGVQEVVDILDRTVLAFDGVSVLYHGGARGADAIAADWAKVRGVRPHAVRADWNRHGKAAGPIRNREMLALAASEADRAGESLLVLAFPVAGLENLGTWHCVREARARGIRVQAWELPADSALDP